MKNILRTLVLAPVVLAAAAFASTSAMAESTLKVPFNFTVNGQICPAGVYSVERDFSGDLVTLKSHASTQSFRWSLRPGEPAPTDTRVVLMFDQIGDGHALRSVQYKWLITPRIDKKDIHTEQIPVGITAGQ